MKTTLAIAALAITAAAANADVVLTFPGEHTFAAWGGNTITTPALNGTLRGIRVSFFYGDAGGSSQACDVSVTVNQHQWGGYLPMINGALVAQSPTGAPIASDDVLFSSDDRGMNSTDPFDNRVAVVGFGNGNIGGSFVLRDVTITLLGLVPSPGAAATLGIAGLAAMRRKRA